MNKPPIYPKSEVPGARSHFDDFSATHISQAPFVHFDVSVFSLLFHYHISSSNPLTFHQGVFFHFHRYYLWLYEQALRTECGYKGTQPYWDWTIDYANPAQSPVFDGSSTSMGSDGSPAHVGIVNISAFGLTVPINPGAGGGCIAKGPFKNHTINLGPVASEPRDSDGGLGYNPRCLTRDLHPEWTNHTKPTDIVDAFTACGDDLGCLDTNAEGAIGFHTSGHFAVGGIMMDPWVSPQDPVFFLHHAQVDRLWSVWQGLDPGKRIQHVYGTQTAFNRESCSLSILYCYQNLPFQNKHMLIYVTDSEPPSANVTLESELDYGRLAGKQRVKDVVSTVDGPFCYAYI
jgi:tyrosinase